MNENETNLPSILELFRTPWVAAIFGTCGATSLVVVGSLLLFVRLRAAKRFSGPHGKVAYAVLRGHALPTEEERAEVYRAVLYHLCSEAILCAPAAAVEAVACRSPSPDQAAGTNLEAIDVRSSGASSGVAREDAAVHARSSIHAAASAVQRYNANVPLAAMLSFALPTEVWSSQKASDGLRTATVAFGGGRPLLGVHVDDSRRVVAMDSGGATSQAGISVADVLRSIDGRPAEAMAARELQEALAAPIGKAVFVLAAPELAVRSEYEAIGQIPEAHADDESESAVWVCCRCSTHNRAARFGCRQFCCFSCRATAVPWPFLLSAPDAAAAPLPAVAAALRPPCRWRQRAWRVRPVAPLGKVEPSLDCNSIGVASRLAGLTWEASCLGRSGARHPTGFGLPQRAPDGCEHHKQVGATCGLAAVNNLLANLGSKPVDGTHMTEVSSRLSEAEARLRDGDRTVEEAGEANDVSEMYARSTGGHFDVQTLQAVFEEAGFHMWYETPTGVEDHGLFDWGPLSSMTRRQPQRRVAAAAAESRKEPAGYVVHRKDALNSRQDHWFIVRQHGLPSSPSVILLQDSLFDQVFLLTRCEAEQLLSTLPPGSLFGVSRAVEMKPPPEL